MRYTKALVLPVGVLVVAPAVILVLCGSRIFGINFFSPLLQVLIGLILCVAGLKVMIVTIKMFASIGEGTLAPWDPTIHLVTDGIYSHVRNPMIIGVMVVLLGETIVFGSLGLVMFVVLVFIANTLYFHYSEEKGLEKRFDGEYLEYMRNVPMWVPRINPWTKGEKRS